ncbi:membrane protein [Betaproteobacteria bacterium]|nr:membrane protein [Betaproteobacteria bacterium]GHU03718.1 membrane protein [Betaproteobacteria bacterium]GHU12080.1 membrane protein [Betaproteobacteria bacterium]GHU22343.1 membrane protein [Betaproteobacteria bacterium]
MTQSAAVWVVLGLALIAANLPFLFERVLLVMRPRAGRKAFGWRVLELVVLYFIVGGAAAVFEHGAYGVVYPQGWEFYAITACLFLVFAFPGFVYRYLWHSPRRATAASSANEVA